MFVSRILSRGRTLHEANKEISRKIRRGKKSRDVFICLRHSGTYLVRVVENHTTKQFIG